MGCAGSKPHANQNSVSSPQKGFIIFNEKTVEYIKANEADLRRVLKERCEHKLFAPATTTGTNKKKSADESQQQQNQQPCVQSVDQAKCLDAAIDSVLRYACNDFDIDNFRSSNHLSMKQIRKDIMKKHDSHANKQIPDMVFYKKALNAAIDEFGVVMQEKFVDINDFKVEAKATNVVASGEADKSLVEQQQQQQQQASVEADEAENTDEQNVSENSVSLKTALEIARQNFYMGKSSMVCVTKAGGYVVKEIDDPEKDQQESQPQPQSSSQVQEIQAVVDAPPQAQTTQALDLSFKADDQHVPQQISVDDVDISATFKTIDAVTTADAAGSKQASKGAESSSLSAKSKGSSGKSASKKTKEELKKARDEEERQKEEQRKAKEEEERRHKEEQKKAKEQEKKAKEEAEKRQKDEQRKAKEEKKAKEEAEKRQKEEQRKAKEEEERRVKEEQKKAKEQEKKAKLEQKKNKKTNSKAVQSPAKSDNKVIKADGDGGQDADHSKAAAVIVAAVVAGASSTIQEEMLQHQQQQQQQKSSVDILDAMLVGNFVCECQVECQSQLAQVNTQLVEIVKSATINPNDDDDNTTSLNKAKSVVKALNGCKHFESFDKGLHECLVDLEKRLSSTDDVDASFKKDLSDLLVKIAATNVNPSDTDATDLKKEIAISILNVGEVLAKTIDRYTDDVNNTCQQSTACSVVGDNQQNELTTHDANDVSITSPSDLVSSSADSTPCKQRDTVQDDMAFIVRGAESTLSNHLSYYTTNGQDESTQLPASVNHEEYTISADVDGNHVETHVVKEYVNTIIDNANESLVDDDGNVTGEQKQKIECHVVHTTTTTTVITSTNGVSRLSIDEDILNKLEEVDKKVKYLNETCSENDDDDDNGCEESANADEPVDNDDDLFKPAAARNQLQEEIKQITNVIQDLVQSMNGTDHPEINGSDQQKSRSERKSSTGSNIPVRKSLGIDAKQQQQNNASNVEFDDEPSNDLDSPVDVCNTSATTDPSPNPKINGKKNKNKKSKSKLPVKQ
jgi:hypothetical protein